ncbi:DASH complex subunit dam1 [Tilletia horrida]|nr:DASH complex subunit dam1 [Tilletia horrida]
MTSPHRVTTPLRRISRGSIPALRQSQSHNNDPSGFGGEAGSSYGPGGAGISLLSSSGAGGSGAGGGSIGADSPLAFLTAAMGDLSHETSILQSNLEAVNSIHEALGVFDENFSMYLYGLKMNAFCVEWPEAPTEENFERADKTQDFLRAQREQQSSILSGNVGSYALYPSQEKASVSFDNGSAPGSASYEPSGDQTPVKAAPSPGRAGPGAGAGAGHGKAGSSGSGAAPAPALKKSGAKGQITIAQKKQRIKFATDIIETLPLEYRGGRDPKPRKIAETVILALIAAGPAGVRSAEIASPPDLPQAKVNMTLLALVQAKHAIRTSSNGVVFSLDPSRHPRPPP